MATANPTSRQTGVRGISPIRNSDRIPGAGADPLRERQRLLGGGTQLRFVLGVDLNDRLNGSRNHLAARVPDPLGDLGAGDDNGGGFGYFAPVKQGMPDNVQVGRFDAAKAVFAAELDATRKILGRGQHPRLGIVGIAQATEGAGLIEWRTGFAGMAQREFMLTVNLGDLS